MPNRPLVSVLVPVFNAATYLPAAINSTLAQRYRDWELVIVDDCSSDGSFALAREAAATDSRIRVYQNAANLGPSATLNQAAAHANGSLLARLDADDTMHTTRLQLQVDYLTAHPGVGLLGSAYQNVYPDGKHGKVQRTRTSSGDGLLAFFLFANAMGHSTVVYRRECFEQVGGYDRTLRASLDYDLLARLSTITECAVLRQVLVDYRTHGSNITSSQGELQLSNAMRVQKWLLDHYGFHYTAQELETHFRLHLLRGQDAGKTDVHLLEEARTWLRELRAQNLRGGMFDIRAFDRVLGEVHTGLYARRGARVRLRDHLRTFTADFGSLTARHFLRQMGHSLKNGL